MHFHMWQTRQEFTTLCDEIKQSGTLPLYLGFKDTWTCLAPWNALAVGLTDSDTCNQVNMGNTTFSDTYGPVVEKMRALLDYAEKIRMHTVITMPVQHLPAGKLPCIRFGSYAIPQIKSVNPDMNIGSFTFPANDEESDNVLNSGIDFQDHHYPSEMSVDAMVQTFLLDTSDNAQEKLLKKFDSDWKCYNRDLIRKVQDYQKEKEEQL